MRYRLALESSEGYSYLDWIRWDQETERTYMPQIEHLAPNFQRIILTNPRTGSVLSVWYSYESVIGFALNGKRTVRPNQWGPTTGKHLNTLEPDHKARVHHEKFQTQLTQAIETHYGN